jgi:hypothetical protein
MTGEMGRGTRLVVQAHPVSFGPSGEAALSDPKGLWAGWHGGHPLALRGAAAFGHSKGLCATTRRMTTDPLPTLERSPFPAAAYAFGAESRSATLQEGRRLAVCEPSAQVTVVPGRSGSQFPMRPAHWPSFRR